MAKHRIGIVGAGARAESFARELYAGNDRMELFGICDIDADRLGKFIAYCGLEKARTWTNLDAFLAEKAMDAVMVTVPDFAHRDVALKAMAAGKHIYLEKPVAPSMEHCYAIVDAHKKSGVVAYVGFNLRAQAVYERLKEVVDTGVLGQIIHVQAHEQMHTAHGASFMRRWHRKRANNGGFLNHKCSHDLDIMQWVIGHEHKITRVASFGGLNVFLPRPDAPKYCHECKREVYDACPYKDRAGFVFPVGGKEPIHKTTQLEVYGGDLCVFNADKEIIDNQTVMMEWDNGVRGDFNLQMFQAHGNRETRIWGTDAVLVADYHGRRIQIVRSRNAEVITHDIPRETGGHGGSDPKMLGRFCDAMEGHDDHQSGLAEGVAATLIAIKAEESMLTGKIMPVRPDEYVS